MDKLRVDLLPPHALAATALAMTVGARKHGPTTYLDWPRIDEEEQQLASLQRHLNADLCGERADVDGFEHLAAVAARALMVLELRRRRAAASPAAPSADMPSVTSRSILARYPGASSPQD